MKKDKHIPPFNFDWKNVYDGVQQYIVGKYSFISKLPFSIIQDTFLGRSVIKGNEAVFLSILKKHSNFFFFSIN